MNTHRYPVCIGSDHGSQHQVVVRDGSEAHRDSGTVDIIERSAGGLRIGLDGVRTDHDSVAKVLEGTHVGPRQHIVGSTHGSFDPGVVVLGHVIGKRSSVTVPVTFER